MQSAKRSHAEVTYTATAIGFLNVFLLTVQTVIIVKYALSNPEHTHSEFSSHGSSHDRQTKTGKGIVGSKQTSSRDKSTDISSKLNKQKSNSSLHRQSSMSRSELTSGWACCGHNRQCKTRFHGRGKKLLIQAIVFVILNLLYNIFFCGFLYDTLPSMRGKSFYNHYYCSWMYLSVFTLYTAGRILLVWFFCERLSLVFSDTAFNLGRGRLDKIRIYSAISYIICAAFLEYCLTKFTTPDYTSDGHINVCIPVPYEWTPSVDNWLLYVSVTIWTANDFVWEFLILQLFISRLRQFGNESFIITGSKHNQLRTEREKKHALKKTSDMHRLAARSYVLAFVAWVSTLMLCTFTAVAPEYTFFGGLDGLINSTCVLCLFEPFEPLYCLLFKWLQPHLMRWIDWLYVKLPCLFPGGSVAEAQITAIQSNQSNAAADAPPIALTINDNASAVAGISPPLTPLSGGTPIGGSTALSMPAYNGSAQYATAAAMELVLSQTNTSDGSDLGSDRSRGDSHPKRAILLNLNSTSAIEP